AGADDLGEAVARQHQRLGLLELADQPLERRDDLLRLVHRGLERPQLGEQRRALIFGEHGCHASPAWMRESSTPNMRAALRRASPMVSACTGLQPRPHDSVRPPCSRKKSPSFTKTVPAGFRCTK